MFIKFESIRWQNFLSTGNDWIEIKLDKSPSTLIYGENGHGKCLDPKTEIDIDFLSEEARLEFLKFINRKALP